MTHIAGSNGMYCRRQQPTYPPSAFPRVPMPPSRIALPPHYSNNNTYYMVTPVSPNNSADEVEAAAALISLPGKRSVIGRSPPVARIPSKNKNDDIYQPTLPPLSAPSSSTIHPPYSLERVVPSSTVTPSFLTAEDASSVSSNDDSITAHPPCTSPPKEWYTGTATLSLPQDDNVLSPLHCFLRRYCVEAFSATEQDVSTPRYGKSHNNKIVLHQVGIRCLHCKSMENKPERAVCYPSSLKNIYHSIETWQRRHAPVCSAIPPWIKRELIQLIETSRSTAGGRRQYWQDAAQLVGLVDTPHGVRFAQPPGSSIAVESSNSNDSSPTRRPQDVSPSTPLVTHQDEYNVTNFLFTLMQQMETCQFQEEDRTGGRSKVKDYPVGFGGMQCKHCRGMAGFGRYFPSSINALALANSDRNVYNHIKKCRKCPDSIKQELQGLQTVQESVKNKRGSRKQFFTKIWNHIHPQDM